MSKKGFFITFEGGDGTGKTTQVKLLTDALVAAGFDAIPTREPGGTPQGELIRDILVQSSTGDLDPKTEILLHSAARREHIVNKIKPSLKKGTWVVSDRFVDSSRVFQGYGMDLDMNIIDDIYQMIAGDFEPDLTFVFDIDPKTGLDRSLKHNKDVNITEDRYEMMGVPFHTKLRKGFSEVAKKYASRCVVIDASQDIQSIHQQILQTIEKRFNVQIKKSAKNKPKNQKPKL